MGTIGSLSVNIVAVTDSFNKGLAKAKGQLSSFAGSVTLLRGAIAGLSVGGLAKMASDVIENGDAVFDMSQKLHIASDALGALEFAAEHLGSSSESLDRGLTFLNKNIGLAQQGSQKAVDAFARLGIEVSQLQSMSVDQTFLAVSKAIHDMKSATEQAATAQQIFGKGGAELLPLLRANTDEIVQLGAEAAKTGSLLTNDQAEAMNNASDSVKTLTASWRGLRIELIEGFVPAIEFTVNRLTDGVQIFRKLQIAIEYATLQMQGLVQDTSVELKSAAKEWEKLNSPSGGGPLKTPAALKPAAASATPSDKETAANTKETADQIKQMVALMKQGYTQNQAALKVVGVR